MTLGSNIFKI